METTDPTTDLLSRDRRVIWHPYSQHGLRELVLPVLSARGSRLTVWDGERAREVIDGISSWWVNLHGHSHPVIAEAIHAQARALEHVIFAGFTHEPAVALAETLLGAFRERGIELDRVFYSDNGSTAVEAALKMAFQLHVNRGDRRRTRFLALRGSYHGDTLGAMAVGDPDGYHSLFKPLLPPVDFIPPDAAGLEELARLLRANPGEHAAFIFEPMIQGAGGMRLVPADFLEEASRLCRQRGVLLVCDEVFTGFYRTGKAFAVEHTGVKPDFICLSKGITGGFLPLAVTLCSREIHDAFVSPDMRAAFLHGHSYTANATACAAALASWKLLDEPACQERIRRIEEATVSHIARLSAHPAIASARCLGTIGAITLRREGSYFTLPRDGYLRAALDRGVLLRPMGNVLYTVPPYCVSAGELDRIYGALEEIAGL